MTPTELAWLAGLLEGEGSFCEGPPSSPNQPVVQLAMTDRDVVERAASLLGNITVYAKKDRRKAHWKPFFQLKLRGLPAVTLMRTLRPFMGERRRNQIDKAIASYNNKRCIKLSRTAAKKIKESIAMGATVSAVAREFNVSRTTIRKVRDNRVHSGL